MKTDLDKQTILLADDYKQSRWIMREILEAEGYHVLEASSGETALQKLKTKSVDLVFLDQEMPGMSGFEVLSYVQANKLSIPVIFLTGFGEIEFAVKAMKLGAVDYLTKPPDRDMIILVAKIGRASCRERVCQYV